MRSYSTVDSCEWDGVTVKYNQRANQITLEGWYNQHIEITSHTVPLRAFFDALGITENDCRRAFRARTK